jgi:hypothetical protein
LLEIGSVVLEEKTRLPTKMATKLKIEKGGMKLKKNLLL